MASASAHFTRTSHVCVFLICEFLCEGGVSAARPYQVLPSSLALVGTSAGAGQRRRSQTQEDQQFRGSKGSFATLLHHRGTLVYVTALDCQLDQSRLTPSLLKDKWFVLPDKHGAHCWHAARGYMRSRLKAPESVCGRWGALVHSLWGSVAGWQPHRMVSRLFM